MSQSGTLSGSRCGVAIAMVYLVNACMLDERPGSDHGAAPTSASVQPSAAGRRASGVSALADASMDAAMVNMPAAAGDDAAMSASAGATVASNDADAGGSECRPPRRPQCCGMVAASDPPDACTCPADQDGSADCSVPAPHGWMKQLVLDGSQVKEPLSDFPVLVRLVDSQLKAAAREDGADIHFLADDSVTSLTYEIERYDPQDGTLVAWVRLPQLTPGVDTIVYLAYQDGQADGSQPAVLWSAYEYVWHLNETLDVTGESHFADSTGRADGTGQGNMTAANHIAGVAAAGVEFDGVDDRIAFRNVYSGADATTISAWVKLGDDVGDDGAMVIALGRAAQGRARFLVAQDTVHRGATAAGFYNNDISGPALTKSRWSYLVWSWDGKLSSLYIDGALVFGPTAHTGANTSGAAGALGASIFSYPRFLKGQLDEVRVANGARTAAFIRTEYANQRPDSTFIKAVGAQVPKP